MVSELTRLMSRDASKDVRKTALQNIAITKATLPHVLRRLRDNKADVRKLLYQVIAWKMPIKKLPISLRCDILKIGLDERIPSVREAFSRSSKADTPLGSKGVAPVRLSAAGSAF